MKVVINIRIGGFCVGRKAVEYMAARGHEKAVAEIEHYKNALLEEDYWYGTGYSEKFPNNYQRTDTLLIEAIEVLGEAANHVNSYLKIVEIPDNVDWFIQHNDMGVEWVAEKHRIWR